MSWSAYQDVEDADGVDSMPFTPQVDHGEAESKAAFEMAKQAAKALIESEAVGLGPFGVRLSGHSNPGCEPSPGYANDMVTVTITSMATGEVPA